MAVNNLELLYEVTKLLSTHGISTWIFGGWAEEINGLTSPREHKDIDLLYPAADFVKVDSFLSQQVLEEVPGKRFFHKRAFIYQSVLVELFLLQPSGHSYVTNFFNKKLLIWPSHTLSTHDYQGKLFQVASNQSLKYYRQNHDDYSYQSLK